MKVINAVEWAKWAKECNEHGGDEWFDLRSGTVRGPVFDGRDAVIGSAAFARLTPEGREVLDRLVAEERKAEPAPEPYDENDIPF